MRGPAAKPLFGLQLTLSDRFVRRRSSARTTSDARRHMSFESKLNTAHSQARVRFHMRRTLIAACALALTLGAAKADTILDVAGESTIGPFTGTLTVDVAANQIDAVDITATGLSNPHLTQILSSGPFGPGTTTWVLDLINSSVARFDFFSQPILTTVHSSVSRPDLFSTVALFSIPMELNLVSLGVAQ